MVGSPNPPDIKYYITDHLHSTGIFADKTGIALDDNDFYPWGGVVPGVGQTTSNNTIKFTGQYRDTDTAANLDYFGARYYSNTIGRFMSPDWAAAPITVPYAKFGDPQSLNLYSYVENGPINRIDADGHGYAMFDTKNASGGETPSFSYEVSFFDRPDFAPLVARELTAALQLQGQEGSQQSKKSAAPPQASLTLTTAPGSTNDSGLDFVYGDDFGPVDVSGRGWFWNVLITATLPPGTDASGYGIKQSFSDKGTEVTENGKKFSLGSSGTETVAPNGNFSTTRGNHVYATDGPGAGVVAQDGNLVKSAKLTIHFKTWIVDPNGHRVSPVMSWQVRIIVQNGELDRNASSAGLK